MCIHATALVLHCNFYASPFHSFSLAVAAIRAWMEACTSRAWTHLLATIHRCCGTAECQLKIYGSCVCERDRRRVRVYGIRPKYSGGGCIFSRFCVHACVSVVVGILKNSQTMCTISAAATHFDWTKRLCDTYTIWVSHSSISLSLMCSIFFAYTLAQSKLGVLNFIAKANRKWHARWWRFVTASFLTYRLVQWWLSCRIFHSFYSLQPKIIVYLPILIGYRFERGN